MPKVAPGGPVDGTHYKVEILKTITYGDHQIVAGSETYMTGAMIKELLGNSDFQGAIGDANDLPGGVTI